MKNGRVNIDLSNADDYAFADTNIQPIYKTKIISGITATPLYTTFFSSNNINFLQNKIIQEVQHHTSYTISKQDENNLIVIMRSIYLQYSKNGNDIQSEINNMNAHIIKYCVNNISSNIKHYLFYLNDISKLPCPLEHPKYMSPDGLKNYKDVIEE